jgi:hypothetical protein
LVFRLVVKKRNLEVALTRRFLQQSEIVIRVRTTLAIPVDYEGSDAHAAGLLNLLAEKRGILAGVAHIHVAVVSKPWHVNCEQLRRKRRRQPALL